MEGSRGKGRRRFLKTAAGGLAGVVLITNAPPAVLRVLSVGSQPGAGPQAPARTQEPGQGYHHWGFVVDTTKCIGCGKCVLACKVENDVPMESHYNRTWVERYLVTEEGEVHVDSPEAGIHGFAEERFNQNHKGVRIVKSYFVPKLCNQCENTPCIQVCPVGATYRTPDGVVLVDRQRCIGCRYCIQACPYGARFLDPRLRVADKCTWCYHRIQKGLRPACVEACPVGARLFGDLNDPESPIRKLMAQERVAVLKPDLGTRPQVHYLGLEKYVR